LACKSASTSAGERRTAEDEGGIRGLCRLGGLQESKKMGNATSEKRSSWTRSGDKPGKLRERGIGCRGFKRREMDRRMPLVRRGGGRERDASTKKWNGTFENQGNERCPPAWTGGKTLWEGATGGEGSGG